MSKYIVTVHEIFPAPNQDATKGTQEIFKQGFDELDLARFVIAINSPKRGRKPAKKEAA